MKKEMKKVKKRSYDVDKDGHIGWSELDIKDKIAYIMSVVLMASGILMAFLCFFLTENHDVTDGVLFYVGEAFVTSGALLGVGLYVKNKFGEITHYLHDRLDSDEDS